VGQQARLVQGKARMTGEEEILDDMGYKTIMRPAVICSDPDQLVQLVLQEWGMNPHTSVVLTGMDDGQGFCKVAVVFLDSESDKENNG